MAGLALLAAGLACGTGNGAAPSMPSSEPSSAAEPAEPQPSPPPGQPTVLATTFPFLITTPAPPPDSLPNPAIPETRRLTLEFPPVMRAGDSTRIRMQLEVDERGNLIPTAMVEGNLVVGKIVEIPNLYETHHVLAEARLDMAGVEISPPGGISESLQPGFPVTFYWSVRAPVAGSYQGVAWLSLRFKPKTGGKESRIPVSAQFLDIEVKSLFGLSGGAARNLGTVGSVFGAVLGFPFVDDLLKWVWGKRRRVV